MSGTEKDMVVLSHLLSLIKPFSNKDTLPASTVTVDPSVSLTNSTDVLAQAVDNSINLSFAHPSVTSSPKPLDATYDIPMNNLDPSAVSFVLQEITVDEGTMFSEEHSQNEETVLSEDASQNATFLMQTDGQHDTISITEVLKVIDNVSMDNEVVPVDLGKS